MMKIIDRPDEDRYEVHFDYGDLSNEILEFMKVVSNQLTLEDIKKIIKEIETNQD